MALAAVRSKAVAVVVDFLSIVTPIVGVCNCLCFVVRYFLSIRLDGEKRAGYFA